MRAEPLLRPIEVARYYGVCLRTVRSRLSEHRSSGGRRGLVHYRIGRRIYITGAEADAVFGRRVSQEAIAQ